MTRIAEDDEEEEVPRASHNNTNMHSSALLVGHQETIKQIKWNALSACTLLNDNSNQISLMVSRHRTTRTRAG